MAQAPDSRFDKLEAAYSGLIKDLESHQRNAERLSQLVTSNIATHEKGMSSGSYNPNGHTTNQVKIDFPKFDGTDPENWLFRAEQYFAYYHTPDPTVLRGIWAVAVRTTQSKAIQANANPVSRGILPTVLDACESTEGVLDDALLDCFIGGLKPEIRREVISRHPPNLQKAMEIAKLFDNFDALAVPVRNRSTNSTTPGTTKIVSQSSSRLGLKSNLPPLLPTPNMKPITLVKKMTPAEMLIRREKGLCYTCDAKFTPGHKCPNKQYMLIEYEESEENTEVGVEQHQTATVENEPISIHHLSLPAYHGSPGKATIRFTGMINGTEVQILLDGGSSDSFIHPRIAQFLKLPIEPTRNVRVMIGDGNAMKGEGIVKKVTIHVQGYPLEFPAFVLAIAGSDIVIGASWLATLGPHVANYEIGNAYIKFYLGSDFITLRGTHKAVVYHATYNHFQRLIHTDTVAECYFLQMEQIEAGQEGDTVDEVMGTEMQAVLDKYQSIFEKPHGLPPPRERDHRILLKEGTEPVKVRLYRYPFSQKTKIEKLVNDLLVEGFIQPSTSPFSAPVILVRKKDGTW
ncbi:uncharacterized protein LOC114715292 [Neltuma alba]|uniref:uncharacterized protein LOC114715292 n=1 Tax=Neltuma alba TaxID=207710 RepID=UPI0010A58B39|nr:uncharacterized protein LOC114715292 [Prosopis alba]